MVRHVLSPTGRQERRLITRPWPRRKGARARSGKGYESKIRALKIRKAQYKQL